MKSPRCDRSDGHRCPARGETDSLNTAVSEHNRAEWERDLAVEFLSTVNANPGLKELVAASVRFFWKHSGCQAVGIRLREGDDFPYYETHGFPEEFVRTENSLCDRESGGEILRDLAGRPVIACMCGNVICRRIDPSKPFFSQKGSFWANDTTRLLSTTTDADRQTRTRNRCNGAGYESVALIALRVGDQTLGLLQLNDRRKGMFTAQSIALWERLAGYLAIAMAHAQAADALRRSESRFRALLTASANALFQASPDWQEVHLIGAPHVPSDTDTPINHLLDQHIPPDDRPHMMAAISQAIRTRGAIKLEHRVLRTDGSMGWVLTRAAPVLGSDEQIIEWFGSTIDISERKAMEQALRSSEQRFRTVFEKAPTGIALANAEGRFQHCNPAYCALLGYSEDELRSMRFPSLLHPQHHDADMQDNMRLAAGSIPYFEKDSRYLCKNGEVVWVHKLVSWLTGPSGDGGYLVLVVDITERKNTERQLHAAKTIAEQAKAEAEAANHAKDQFLARLSHELRTPLTPVLLAVTQWQARKDVPAAMREDLEMMRRNLELEARLLEDLLDVSRILHGKLPLHRETIDLHTKITRTLEILNADIKAKRIGVQAHLQARHSWIDGDVARIQQVFWNLLSNALKFTPDGGRITICSSNDGSGHIRVQITDTGRGIEPELLPRVFLPFEQGGHQTTSQYGGMGLGLAITRSVVEMHGGSITAHSEGHGHGTTITVCFPTATKTVAAAGLSAAHPPQASSRGCRVLLVEDHLDTAKLLARLLKAWGHQVRIAHSVDEALSAARQPFDLLISDLGLPDGNGHDLMRQLSADHTQSFRAIALSGFGMENDQQRSRDVGFSMHLTKPVNAAELRAAIATALGRD